MANKNDWVDVPLDDWEDVSIAPEEVEEVSLANDSNAPSIAESSGRGAVQGATFGLGDEVGAAALTVPATLYEKIASYISGTPENVDKELRDQGFTGDIQSKNLIEKYKELRDTSREADTKSKDENPYVYGASEIAGGVLPALATGGGSAAASAATLSKEGLKQAAKLGAKYGAASGAGYSEADNLSGLAEDTALGGVLGAGAGVLLPSALKGLKAGVSKVGSGTKNVLESLIPESKAIKAGYQFGKEGKALTQDIVDDEMKSLAKTIVSKLKSAKNSDSLKNIRSQMDELGIKINTKKAIKETIDDLEKIAKDDILDISDKSLLSKLQKLAGVDIQGEKLVGRAEKLAIKKAVEAESRGQQAIIKGEKALSKDAIKSGDSLDTIQDIERNMNDLDIPLSTSEGKIGGVKGKFTGPEGNYTKQVLNDVTDYQPEISKILGPDGRPIIKTTDLGSGKVSAIVGDIEDNVNRNLENMTVSEVESLRKQLNVITDLAKSQGTVKDPVISRAKKLAVELRDLTNKAVEEAGDDTLTSSRKRMSDLLSAEDLLGVSRTKAVSGSSVEAEKVRTLVDKLGFNKGFKTRDEAAEAFGKVGEDVISSADKSRFDLFKQLNSVMGRESQENISRAGVYKKLVGDVPNLVGRGAKKVQDKIVSPVVSAKKSITDLSEDQLSTFGTKLLKSKNKGLQNVGQRLLDATQMDDMAKNQLLWSLSQSPAMRQLITQQAKSVAQDEQEIMKYSEPEESEDGTQVENSVVMSGLNEPKEGVTREPSADFAEEIGKRESSNNYEAVNQLGYLGKYQFGGMALQDLGYKDSKGNWIGKNGIESKEDFLANPEIQEAAFAEWQPILKRYLDSKGAFDYIGQDFNGVKVTEKGLMAAAHLVGAGAVKKMLVSGEVPQDANGTKATEYMRMFEDEEITVPKEQVEVPSGADISDIEHSIDITNQLQGSGDETPVDQLDDLLSKINSLALSEEATNELEHDAVNMTSYTNGLELKEKIRKLMGA